MIVAPTALHADPPSYAMSSRETLPIRFDLAPLLAQGETASAPEASLTNLTTGVEFPTGLQGAPTLAGNYLTQVVTALAKGATYRLSVRFTAGSGKEFDVLLEIPCVD